MNKLIFIVTVLSAGSNYAADTELKLFHPFEGIGLENNRLKKEALVGQCYAQSAFVLRENAWQCSAEAQHFDPCFVAKSDSKTAVCRINPWSYQVTYLKLKTLPDKVNFKLLDMSQTLPWAVELVGGARCLKTLETHFVNEAKVLYQCDTHTLLVEHLQRCKPEWSVLRYDDSEKTGTEIVTKAWF